MLTCLLLAALVALTIYHFCRVAGLKETVAFLAEDVGFLQAELQEAQDERDAAVLRVHAVSERADSEKVMLRDAHRSRLARQQGEIRGLREANCTLGAELNEANLKIEAAFVALGGVADVEIEELTLKELMEMGFKERYGDDCLGKDLPNVEMGIEGDPEMVAFAKRLRPEDHIPYGQFTAQGTEGQPLGYPHPQADVIPFADDPALPSQARVDQTGPRHDQMAA